MRKLLRLKMRHQAENEMRIARKQASKAKVKKPIGYRTIDVFRYLWKEHLRKLGRSMVIRNQRKKPTKKYAW
jgi:hypothetical protein